MQSDSVCPGFGIQSVNTKARFKAAVSVLFCYIAVLCLQPSLPSPFPRETQIPLFHSPYVLASALTAGHLLPCRVHFEHNLLQGSEAPEDLAYLDHMRSEF